MQEGSPRAQRILIAAEAAAAALQIMTVPGMPQRGEGPIPRMSWQLLLLLPPPCMSAAVNKAWHDACSSCTQESIASRCLCM